MGELIARLRNSTWLERAGIGAFGLGALLDSLYHLAPAWWHPILVVWLGADGTRAHELTLLGMLLILSRLIQIALQSPREAAIRKEVRSTSSTAATSTRWRTRGIRCRSPSTSPGSIATSARSMLNK